MLHLPAGWLVGGKASYFVRNGRHSQDSCTRDSLLWNQGDQLVLTLDTRRDKDHASISILNTVTGTHKSMNAEPTIPQNSSNGSHCSPGKGTSRLGIRHRYPGSSLSVNKQEIMAVLNRQPGDAEVHVAELVVGAAMQVLEAQGIGMQAAINVLRQPGLVARLVQQVRHAQQTVRRQAAGAQRQQQQHEPAARVAAGSAAAADGAAGYNAVAGASGGSLDLQSTADSAATNCNASAASADNQQQQGAGPFVVLSNGCIMPKSSAEFEWVLVVGLVQPKDSLRLISVKRRGQSPSPA